GPRMAARDVVEAVWRETSIALGAPGPPEVDLEVAARVRRVAVEERRPARVHHAAHGRLRRGHEARRPRGELEQQERDRERAGREAEAAEERPQPRAHGGNVAPGGGQVKSGR